MPVANNKNQLRSPKSICEQRVNKTILSETKVCSNGTGRGIL